MKKTLLAFLSICLLIFILGCEKRYLPKSEIKNYDSLISIDTPSNNDTLITCESFIDITDLLESHLLENYEEKSPLKIGYRSLAFSPDGNLLAIFLHKIGSDQVWILDIKKIQIQSAVDKNIKNLFITSVYWMTEDTLIINAESDNKYIRFHSTIGGFIYEYITRDSIWESLNLVSPTGKYEVTFPDRQTIKLINLKNNKTKFWTDTSMNLWDQDVVVLWSPLDEFFFINMNHGHGELSLYAGFTEPKFKIIELTKGTWADNFAVSPISHDVAFVDNSHFIKIYNLDSLKVIKKIQTGVFPGILAWSVHNHLAFTANYCQENLDSLRKENGYLPLGNRRLYLVKL
jgi:hypothetical protein